MTTDSEKLLKLIAKLFRKAKHYYAGYLACQCVVLVFAIVSIFAGFNPNFSAAIAFLAVLGTETIRWCSDRWKAEAETFLRKREIADGLGIAVDGAQIADWLAANPSGFLSDVGASEMEGSEFESVERPGPLRLVKNTQESAWWSKHLSSRMAFYLGVILLVIVICALAALSFCISMLKKADGQGIAVTQNVGGIICSVLVFIFSINVIRLFIEFSAFATQSKETLKRCEALLNSPNLSERDALSLLHDYQTARNSAPLLPTLVWKLQCSHLREQWADFRREPR